MSALAAIQKTEYQPNPVLDKFKRKMHPIDAEGAYADWEEKFLIEKYEYHRVVFSLADAMQYEGNESNDDKLLDSIRGGDIQGAKDALENILHYAAQKYAEDQLERKLREMEDEMIEAEWESRRYDEPLWH